MSRPELEGQLPLFEEAFEPIPDDSDDEGWTAELEQPETFVAWNDSWPLRMQ